MIEETRLKLERVDASERRMLEPAIQMTLLSLANIGVGFLVQVVMAAEFGAGIEMDAYLAATTIPTAITAILLSGLEISLVPVFTQIRRLRSGTEAWRVVSTLTSLSALFLGVVSVTGVFVSEQLLRVTVPGFAVGSPRFILAVRMARILYPSIVFVGLTALFSSVAYAEKKFILPSAAPVVRNLFTILGTILLSGELGIEAVAWATLAGTAAGFSLLLPIAIGPSRFGFLLDLRHPGVKQTMRVLLPLVLGALIFRSNTIVDRFVASTLPDGSISHLGYGLKILNILWAITSSGIVASVFPFQSEHASSDHEALGQVTATGLRLSIISTMAVGPCFLVLRHSAIKALFERGAFDAQATYAIADIILFYAGALFVPSIMGSITYALYSLQQTGLTTLVSVAGGLFNFVLVIPLSRWLGANGVALAYSIASVFNAILLTVLLTCYFQIHLGCEILVCFLKSFVAAMIAGTAIGIPGALFFDPSLHSVLENGAWILGMSTLFVIIYVGTLLLLRVDDIGLIWRLFCLKVSQLASREKSAI